MAVVLNSLPLSTLDTAPQRGLMPSQGKGLRRRTGTGLSNPFWARTPLGLPGTGSGLGAGGGPGLTGWSTAIGFCHGGVIRQLLALLLGQVPRQEGLKVWGRLPARCGTAVQIPPQPPARIDPPQLQGGQQRKQQGRQATAPQRPGTVVVLAAQRRPAQA